MPLSDVFGLLGLLATLYLIYLHHKPDAEITNLFVHDHGDYFAISFCVITMTKGLKTTSISVPKCQIAFQDHSNGSFGPYQLHLVKAPSDELFSDSLPFELLLRPGTVSGPHVFVVKKSNCSCRSSRL